MSSAALVAALCLSSRVAAEDTQPYEPRGYEFLERNAIAFSPQKITRGDRRDSLVFEAQVGPHLTLFGLTLPGSTDPLRGGTNHELRLIFTFQTTLRTPVPSG